MTTQTGEVTLEFLAVQQKTLLDEMRGMRDEETHNRQVNTFILAQMKTLRTEFDENRTHLALIDGRLDRLDRRLDRFEETAGDRLSRIEGALTRILDKLG